MAKKSYDMSTVSLLASVSNMVKIGSKLTTLQSEVEYSVILSVKKMP